MKYISKKIKFTLFFIILFLIAGYFLFSQNIKPEPALVQAQTEPQINSAPAIIQHKQSVTIQGAGFGTKSQAAPLKWDDFESGTVGAQVIPNNGWTYWAQLGGVTYTGINQRTGSRRSTYHDVTYTSPAIGLYYDNSVEVYASYYVRHHITKVGTIGGPQNVKEFKLFGDGGTYQHEYPDNAYEPAFGIEVPDAEPGPTKHLNSRFTANTELEITASPSGADWGLAWFPNDIWIRREVWMRVGDTPGQRFKYWENAVLSTEYANPSDFPKVYETGESVGPYMGDWDSKFTEIWFFAFIRGGSQGYSQFDDIYIDTTPARVEVGNAATFNACTHREIQIPTAWSSGSITFTANQGSFANGATAYLYVVDENGNVNEQGRPITFGTATPDTTPPSAPTGVSVQ